MKVQVELKVRTLVGSSQQGPAVQRYGEAHGQSINHKDLQFRDTVKLMVKVNVEFSNSTGSGSQRPGSQVNQ